MAGRCMDACTGKAAAMHGRRHTSRGIVAFRVAAVLLAVLGAMPGCRKPPPPKPPPQQPRPSVTPAHVFVDRRTRVYHRSTCPDLPPPEFRVRLDRKMLELTQSLNTPCDVCKPGGSKTPSGGPPREAPPEGAPLPPPPGS